MDKAIFQSTPSVGRATKTTTSSNISNNKFQSTPSVGRATFLCRSLCSQTQHFNPRPPWGGRRLSECTECEVTEISIHALRGEGDCGVREALLTDIAFQSTPSVGRATAHTLSFFPRGTISIHALRGEGDTDYLHQVERNRTFQSTPSVGRATARNLVYNIINEYFNPRPPWGGRPRDGLKLVCNFQHFNPRPPWGGRHQKHALTMMFDEFQSTPSVGRATNTHI